MEEEQDPSPEYIKGFNQMYKLKREMPEVAQQMLSAKAEGERFKGMAAGARQYELERIREVSQKGREQSREREI
ncbi:hypothetical protein [Mucilaginibacter psychrotolerans]|uniref:Uncharacterized protein n=1 Tax=Mucilaginibacter psychrotolerans TaxID=1524096 RepID=A0A4Y8SH29_9SPHI|nr:hypothetical protein [Mucilaginibacter psychrotolerans]TFF37940.1 hypothetical protein E2R66_10145 [Mucilaginibacter psychrotolerans]